MAVSGQQSSNLRYLFLIAVFVLAIYVAIPQIGSLHSSWHLLKHPELKWLVVAVGLTSLTYLAAAGTYFFLAFRPLRYWPLVLIEVAAMFVNRLLPAGIGALGTNYAYLRRRKHSQAQSATMIAANNIIGVVGHVVLVLVALAVYGGDNLAHFWRQWSFSHLAAQAFIVGALIVLVAAVAGRRRVSRAMKSLRKPLRSYASKPQKLLKALLTSITLTACNVLCLQVCALALGVHVPFVAVLVVFSFGVGVATATPTPGGLGGFEAGLFGGFVAYHVPAPTALAAALLYRLVSFWLPLLVGALAFAVSQQKKLI
ncbi:MAG TPA: YbhN family protein [Candidatus Saccharimonadia bacterium]|nr:YbhN family protein [Candidatus Saccharimonadia bacterium]